MTVSLRKVTSVVGVTALAAGAAYGVGIERSDTSNAAATDAGAADGWDHPGPGPGLSELAKKLGVSNAELQKALGAVRPDGVGPNGGFGPGGCGGPGGPPGMGGPGGPPGMGGPGGAPGMGGPGGPPEDFGASLAKELGVTQAELMKAFQAAPMPSFRDGAPGQRPDDDALAASLAKSLGLDKSKVEEALAKEQKAHEAQHQDEEKKLAEALAKELGLPADKVEQALKELGPQRP